MTPTVPVTVDLASQGGPALAGITVRARLDINEVYQGFVISGVVEAVTDADGVAILNCFPNAPAPAGLGTQGSTYTFRATIPGGRSLNVEARVPNTACRLENILVSDTAVPLDAAQAALLQAQTAITTAATSAADAEASASAAAGSASAASVSEANAASSASAAAGSAAQVAYVYPGSYPADPSTRPDGSAVQSGDQYFNSSDNLSRRFNGATWVASDVNTANLAATGGSALVGYDGGTLQDIADAAKPMQSYTALRAYTGRATAIRITNIATGGLFTRDTTDTASADDGGTIIVDASSRRWKRVYDGPMYAKWFGIVGDGVADDTTAIQAAFAAAQAKRTSLIVGNAVIKHSTKLTVQGFSLICDGPSHTRFEFWGTGTQMEYIGETGLAVPPSDQTKGFMLLSKATGQNGLHVKGTTEGISFGRIVLRDHDGFGCQFGVAGSTGVFFADTDYIWCHAYTRAGTTGFIVDGGGAAPNSNANVFKNVYVGGKWATFYDVRSNGNIFLGGDAEFNQSSSPITEVFKISGNNNKFIGMYIENTGGSVFPATIWNFTSTSFSNTFERPLLQMQIPKGGIEKFISDSGAANSVYSDPVGLNFPFASRQSSGINLIQNTEFNGVNGSPSASSTPFGWMTFAAGSPLTRDTTITRGTAASAKLSGTNLSVFYYLCSATAGRARFNLFPKGYYLGKNIRAGCWVYSTTAGCGQIRVGSAGANGTNTSAAHSGSGQWEFLSTSVKVDPSATEIYLVFIIPSGVTGDAYFSEPMLVVGNELPAFSPSPLMGDRAFMSGRFALAPPATFTDGDVTPDVSSGNIFKATNTAATTITNFTNPVPGQEIKVQATNANTTIANNANIVTTTGANKLLTANAIYKFLYDGTKWYEY